MNKPIIIQGALQSEIDYILKKFQIKNKTNLGRLLKKYKKNQ